MKLLKYKKSDIAQERIASALKMLDDPKLEYTSLDHIICGIINFMEDVDHDYAFEIIVQLEMIRGLIEALYNED